MLEKYYDFLQPVSGDRILVVGDLALPIALYIAGRAKAGGLNVSAKAMVDTASMVNTEPKAVEFASGEGPEALRFIESGAPLISINVGDFFSEPTAQPYSKIIFIHDFPEHLAEKVGKIASLAAKGGTVLFEFPSLFMHPLQITHRGFVGSHVDTFSLKQLVLAFGLNVQYYDLVGKKLFCKAQLSSLNRKMFEAKTEVLGHAAWAEAARKELMPTILAAAGGSRFAVRSDSGEYLFLTQVEDVKKSSVKISFIFPDGRQDWDDGVVKEDNKSFSVIVLPNTDSLRKEIEEKDILLISKKGIGELYAQK